MDEIVPTRNWLLDSRAPQVTAARGARFRWPALVRAGALPAVVQNTGSGLAGE
ncbi:hypothetical protein [Sodaliphilus pleomorphus]|uniref:hypothetical protein n=1 Tax=Sodaliphilus pleomorphus TaxID=2606626 RepID=UPI0012B009FE|nr:hypothetical protein [Sodaliphilus pleomorphus]